MSDMPTPSQFLDDEEESNYSLSENKYLRHIIKSRRRCNTWMFTLVTLSILLTSFLGIMTWTHNTSSSNSQQWMDCGQTAEEARARNCHYEQMHRSWIPDACYFPEPGDEYRPFRDRQWFQDEYLTKPATPEILDRLESGDEKMAYAEYFHDEHCVYAWRKLDMAVRMRKPYIDSKTFDEHHTMHCAKRIADVLHHSENSSMEHYMGGVTVSPLMFQTCVELPWKEL